MLPMDTKDLNRETLNLLESCSGSSRVVDGDMKYWAVTFPAAPASDYRFTAYIHADGEVQIGAIRNNAPDDEYFWYMSYEAPDFNSLKSMHSRFLDDLKALLTHETCITQKKGLLFGSFTCSFKGSDGWKDIGGTSYLKFGNFKVPPLRTRSEVYRSGAVRNEA